MYKAERDTTTELANGKNPGGFRPSATMVVVMPPVMLRSPDESVPQPPNVAVRPECQHLSRCARTEEDYNGVVKRGDDGHEVEARHEDRGPEKR